MKWVTPLLATLTVIFEAGHLTAHMPPESVVMILAILTALMAWLEGFSGTELRLGEPPTVQPPKK